jgi:hypothetical protein
MDGPLTPLLFVVGLALVTFGAPLVGALVLLAGVVYQARWD